MLSETVAGSRRRALLERVPVPPAIPRRAEYGFPRPEDIPGPTRLTMRELARTIFRVYGRFPGQERGLPGVTTLPGDDGFHYPERLWLEYRAGSVDGLERLRPPEGLGYCGHDSFISVSLADHVFVNEVKWKFSHLDTPFLVFDISRLMENYLLFRRLLNGAEVFYPVKCNDHPFILGLLRDWGSGFEAASWQEVRGLLELGVEPGRIIFGAPVKAEGHIARAYREGVETYAYDSREEIEKLSRAAPGCQVYLRLAVPDLGASVFPLSGKFGAPLHDAHRLLWAAHDRGLRPVGLSFHVGSQCLDPRAWWLAVAAAARVWERVTKQGMRLEFLNLGGGIPVSYRVPVPEKEVFISHVNLALKGHFQKPPRIIVEPGRALVGDAAIMVATVIGKARRQGMDWIYIDAGTYQGLVEAVQEKERFSYLVYAEGREPLRRYNVGGPTCDSEDVVAREALLPELRCGDRVYILHAGAYSNVCATEFNGFPPPTAHFICSRAAVCR